jgi:hypothetical protein
MYAKIENGVAVEYPLYEGDLERRFPDLKFPLDSHVEENGGITCPDGYAKVSQSNIVRNDIKINYIITMPVKESDGVWREQFNLVQKTEEELTQIKPMVTNLQRTLRNTKLTESDVSVLSDRWAQYTDQQKLEWANYRQELRDVTLQPGFPFDITWPIKPTAFTIRAV